MSRIGKTPITVPAGVKIAIDPAARKVSVEGPKGKQAFVHQPVVTVKWLEGEKQIVCSIPEGSMDDRRARAFWGTTRAQIRNMIEGVTQNYNRKLEIVGVGWKAEMKGKNIQLNVGYCNPVLLPIPDGLTVVLENANNISITGCDRQLVGQFAAVIRSQRPPEPYNGKGIKYSDEVIQRKQGKAFGA